VRTDAKRQPKGWRFALGSHVIHLWSAVNLAYCACSSSYCSSVAHSAADFYGTLANRSLASS